MSPQSVKHCKDSFLDILFPDFVVTKDPESHMAYTGLYRMIPSGQKSFRSLNPVRSGVHPWLLTKPLL
ncbi:hypothetical protein SAMN05660337_1743 [Maridesulfovibrio ferrireducens]|uniref:Uncharacterized protein n=1 Tax=Maridesulfovibrio ferrireducens TaxID=246191 RepID=A0A1G9FXA9_9BACT|nr:hypothetical protein SAMN05660337_1743 [Maridesulfovibrio ferrireducens]